MTCRSFWVRWISSWEKVTVDMSKTKSNPTGNSVPSKARESSVALLNQALADLGDLYSQTKQAHWNVRGKNFYSHHLFWRCRRGGRGMGRWWRWPGA